MADGVSISFVDEGVEKLLTGYLKRVQKPKKLLDRLERYVDAVTLQMFKGRRPDTGGKRGQTWPKLKRSTLDQKAVLRKKGRAIEIQRPLVRTGKMRDSLKTLKRMGAGFEYGTKVRSDKGFPYPGVHQVGGGNLPARKWLFLNSQDLRQMVKMTIDHVQNRLKTAKSYVRK